MLQYDIDNAKEWVFKMQEVLTDGLFVRLVITLWAIWSARRKAVYEDIFQSPMSTHMFIQA